jgi:hypothetical protein
VGLPKWTLPQRAGKRLFYLYNDGLRNQPVLYMQQDVTSQPVELLDPNKFSDDGTVALTTFSPSGMGICWPIPLLIVAAIGKKYAYWTSKQASIFPKHWNGAGLQTWPGLPTARVFTTAGFPIPTP